MKALALIALTLAIAHRLQAQNLCDDAELRRLKSLPKASLTETERRSLDKLVADCERAKGKNETPLTLPNAAQSSAPRDSVATTALPAEPFATTRNFAILGAIGAFVAGIIVALNSITDSPF